MSAETQENSFLDGVRSEVSNIQVFQEGDDIGVRRDIEQAAGDDEGMGSPLAESVGKTRKNLQSSQHETTFDLYDAMLDLDPELSGAVNAIAQSASNFDVVSPNDEPTPEGETAVGDCRDLINAIDGDLMAIDILRNLIVYGNDINKKIYTEGEGMHTLQNLPINAMTIVDDAEDLGGGPSSQIADYFESFYQQNSEEADVEEGRVNEVFARDAYVLNEKGEGDPKVIQPHNVLHFSIDARSNWHTDVCGRETYGVWGKSRIEPLEFTIQTKYNTLTNKVAMDDKLLAREIYYIDTTELFGDINDFEKRKKKAKNYAKEIKKMIEGLGPDERPILPEHVDVEIIGPEGKAIDQQPFLEQLNNAIAAALTFPMAGLGRGTTSVKAGEEISSLWAENNIRNLRRSVIRGFEEMFEDHLKLKHPDWVENSNDAGNISEMQLREDIEIPTLEYEPFREEDMTEKARQIKLLTQNKTMTAAERREHFGLPTDEESIENLKEEYGSLDPLEEGDLPGTETEGETTRELESEGEDESSGDGEPPDDGGEDNGGDEDAE